MAQLDSALDSDVSGTFGRDMAQSLDFTGLFSIWPQKSIVVAYSLTTIFEKADYRRKALIEYMCPWRSWIARQTPTLKVAGSNPVGHTKISVSAFMDVGILL